MKKRLFTSIAIPLLLTALLVGVLYASAGEPQVVQARPLFPGTPTEVYSTFLILHDTPGSYSGEAGHVPVVNSGETALDFASGLFWDDANDRLGLRTDEPGDYHGNANNFVVYENGASGLTIASAANNGGSIFFADGTAGDAAYRGSIVYDHANDKLVLRTAGVDNRAVIDSSGNVGVADSTPSYRMDVAGTIRAQDDLRADDDLVVADDATIGGITQVNEYLDVNGPTYTEGVYVTGNEEVTGGIFIGAAQSEAAGGQMQIRGYKSGSGGFALLTYNNLSSDTTIFADAGNVGPLRAIKVSYLIRNNITFYHGDFFLAHSGTYTLAVSGGDTLVLDFDRPIVPGTRGKLWLDHTGNGTYDVVLDMLLID